MELSPFFQRKRAGADQTGRYRPALECLEDRHLLSGGFGLVNLASDVPGLARVTDPRLVNPWGIAYSPTGPFWFAEDGSGVSDILDGSGEPSSLIVTVPSTAESGSAPTGTVFNSGAGFVISENGVFRPSRFLFASKDGTISGWSAVVDPTRALLAVDNSSSGAVYTGLAIAADATGNSFLYAADFSRGTIDVFNQDFRPVVRPGSFQDPNLPEGFAPFNIQKINDMLFVTYARQDEDKEDDVPGQGNGFIDVFDSAGRLVRHFASQGALDSPWGLALAPAGFGPFGGALLVGNNGDGRINAYNPASGAFLGELASDTGAPIALPDLWALTFGNGHVGGDSDTLFFAAGVGDDEHGVFGAVQPPDRLGANTAGLGAFDPRAPGEPGDYPLPPSNGPAFRASGQDRLVADLLPLREASLAMVPTLSTIAPPSTRVETPVLTLSGVGESMSRFGFTAVPVADAIVRALADSESRPASTAHSHAIALNAFLDLNASQGAQEEAGVQRPGAKKYAIGARSLPSPNLNDRGESLLSDAYVGTQETQSYQEQGPAALRPSGTGGGTFATVDLESRPESVDDPATGEERVTSRDDSLTKVINTLFVVSIPVLWAFWARHHTRLRQLPKAHGGNDAHR
jgi:uncharacterized protein (TIGR03118 family)